MFQTNLVFLGDSILLRLQNMKSFSKIFKDFNTINLSVSGCRIVDGYQTLESESRTNPESLSNSTMVVLLGTNDWLRNRKFNAEVYKEIVELAVSLCSKLVLIKVPPIPLLPELNREIFDANKSICDSFETRENIVIIDPLKFHHHEAHIDVNLFEATYHTGKKDLIHLNLQGLTVLADSILQCLESKNISGGSSRPTVRFSSEVDFKSCSSLLENDSPNDDSSDEFALPSELEKILPVPVIRNPSSNLLTGSPMLLSKLKDGLRS